MRGSLVAGTAAALATVVLAAGCTSDDAGGTSGSAAPTTASTGAPGTTSSTGGSSGSRTGGTTAPSGSLSVVPTRAQTTKPPVPIRSRASFGGGLSARLVSFTPAKITDRGPGAVTDRAATRFTVEFANSSSAPVSLAAVQVSALYGDDLSASPVNQNQGAAAGRLAPGATKRATYTFAIPKADLDQVRVAVAIDPRRPTVVFSGSVR